MEQNIYTIHDSKADAFLQPFFMRQDAEARRAFEQLVLEPGHRFNQTPEDYTLFKIGTWDEFAAKIESTPIESLINGKQVKPRDN